MLAENQAGTACCCCKQSPLAPGRVKYFFPLLKRYLFAPRGLFLSDKALAPTELTGRRQSKGHLYISFLTQTHTKGRGLGEERKRTYQKCKMKGIIDQHQDISVQQLFPHPSNVQRPHTVWFGSQMQSYPQTTHGPEKTPGFTQVQEEEIHSELTVHDAFRGLRSYGPAPPLVLSNLSKSCSFHKQRPAQTHC